MGNETDQSTGVTLFDKIWNAHLVSPETDTAPAILYIDLQLLHEVSSPQAFAELARRGLPVRCPERQLATIDHSTPTLPPDAAGRRTFVSEASRQQVDLHRRNTHEHGIRLLDWDDGNRGIVHAVAPELGLTLPGMTIVCGDSHTATHGAFGALAFGIGTSESANVLATQALIQRRPRTMRINVNGRLAHGASAKDMALAIIKRLGIAGGTGHVLEYAGEAIEALDMEQRMTLCNMTIEGGARAGLIGVDEVTIGYLRAVGRFSDAEFEQRATEWRQYRSDADARFDAELEINVSELEPLVTWGTTPNTAVPVSGTVPSGADPAMQRAREYMGLYEGQRMEDVKVDTVFVGSCTNGRISDLRTAAAVLRGRKVSEHVRMLVVPASEAIRRQAENEGLDRIFIEAGAEWRAAGCSMCIAMNGDVVASGQLAVSTSNRNFEGRQGIGARTILASPATAAAAAVAGHITDPRRFMDEGPT
jgi:3-isopropylmalate/(R)-2-methylmalate dehydratase large subunit